MVEEMGLIMYLDGRFTLLFAACFLRVFNRQFFPCGSQPVKGGGTNRILPRTEFIVSGFGCRLADVLEALSAQKQISIQDRPYFALGTPVVLLMAVKACILASAAQA
jgi:hypothetical protein